MMTIKQYYLNKIAEEAVEVAQIAIKAAHFGLTEKQPGNPLNNAERISGELNDLNAMVLRLGDVSDGQFFFDIGQPDHVAIAKKLAKVEHFLAYSQSLGLVEHDESAKTLAGMMESMEQEIAVELSIEEVTRFRGHTLRVTQVYEPGRTGAWFVDGVRTHYRDVAAKVFAEEAVAA